jgi:O-antigen/teichoic acid export membrane protein
MQNDIPQLTGYLRNSLFRNSFYLIANTAATSVLGFFFWMIVARFYSEADVGLASAITSAMSMVANLGLAGFNITLIRYLAKSNRPLDLINTCLNLSAVLSVIIGTVFIIGLDYWSPIMIFIKHNIIFSAAFVVFGAVTSLSLIIDSIYIAGRKSQFVLIKNVIISSTKILLPILLVLFFRSFGIVAAWGIATAFALVISLWFFVPYTYNHFRLRPLIDLSLMRGLWSYSFGNFFASTISLLPGWILPIIVVNVLGPEQNAHYYVAWMISSLLSAIPIASSNSLFAEGARFEENLWINFRRTLKFNYLLLIPSSLIFIILSSFILSFFGVNYSVNGATLLKLLAISALFNGIIHPYFTILRIQSKIKELIVLYLIQSIAVLVGCFVGARYFGLPGIGYVQISVLFVISIYVFCRLWRLLFFSKLR